MKRIVVTIAVEDIGDDGKFIGPCFVSSLPPIEDKKTLNDVLWNAIGTFKPYLPNKPDELIVEGVVEKFVPLKAEHIVTARPAYEAMLGATTED